MDASEYADALNNYVFSNLVEKVKEDKSKILDQLKSYIDNNKITDDDRENKNELAYKAFFYLQTQEEGWRGDPRVLPPVYQTIQTILDKPHFAGVLKTNVKLICGVPPRDQEKYEQWAEEKKTQYMFFNNLKDWTGEIDFRLLEKHFADGSSAFYGLSSVIDFGEQTFSENVTGVISKLNVEVFNQDEITKNSAHIHGIYVVIVGVYNGVKVYEGERTPKRALQCIISKLLALGVSYKVGSALTFAVAAYLGVTAGAIVPVVVGALGGKIAECISYYMTDKTICYFLDLPYDELDERACITLGCTIDVDGKELSSKYRCLSRKYHPHKFESETFDEKARELNLCNYFLVQAALILVIAKRNKSITQYEEARKTFTQYLDDMENIKGNLRHKVSAGIRRILGLMKAERKVVPGIAIFPYNLFEETDDNGNNINVQK